MRTALLISLALSVLPGCGDNADKAGVQLVARVNGAEISLHRVKQAEPAVPAMDADRQEASRALERVIDQELLVQAAQVLGLERDPDVSTAIEAARRQILAQAFVEKASGEASRNTSAELRAFYEQHPDLFERRRIYRFQELAVSAPREELDALKQEAAGARSLDEMSARLKSRNLASNMATVTRPAEQLPLGYLPQLSAMSDGEMAVLGGASGISVLQLLQSQDAPLSLKQAEPIIDRFLQGRKRLQIAEAAVRRLREKATIEYAGEFARKRPDVPGKQPGIAQVTTPGGSAP